MPLGMEVGLGPGDFVLDGDPSPPPKNGAEPPSPQLSAHVHCGQTAGWIKMTLGPGRIVPDGDQLPSLRNGQSPPIFGPCLLWPNGCMRHDTTWHGVRPQPM